MNRDPGLHRRRLSIKSQRKDYCVVKTFPQLRISPSAGKIFKLQFVTFISLAPHAGFYLTSLAIALIWSGTLLNTIR